MGAWERENADVTPEACSWFFCAASPYLPPRLPLTFHTTFTFAPPTPPTPRTVQVRELRELFNAYLEQISAIEDPAVEVLLVQALEAVDMLDGAIALQKVWKGGVEVWGGDVGRRGVCCSGWCKRWTCWMVRLRCKGFGRRYGGKEVRGQSCRLAAN